MRKATAAFSQSPHLIMKIRSILMLGWLLGLAAATGQEAKPDAAEASKPELAVASGATASAAELDPILRLRLETWEAPALEVAKRLDGIKNPADLEKLRQECLGGPPGVILVMSSAIAVSTPSKVVAESVTERIYPTEYEPPSLTCPPPVLEPKEQKPADFDAWLEKMAGRATPTAFETRNTDTTLEADISRAAGQEKTWNANIAIEDVRYLGRESFGAEELGMGMPAFSTFRSTSSLRLREGQWQILSVMEPPRGLESKPSDKRWITLVRLDPQE
jgi:hypothetical protein